MEDLSGSRGLEELKPLIHFSLDPRAGLTGILEVSPGI
jgi:hypothetical protein